MEGISKSGSYLIFKNIAQFNRNCNDGLNTG